MTKTINPTISRRSVILSAAPLVLAAGGVTSSPAASEDLPLRALWAQYLEQAAQLRELRTIIDPGEAAFNAQHTPPWDFPAGHFLTAKAAHDYGDEWRGAREAAANGSDWGAARDEWERVSSEHWRIMETIRATSAETLFGLGVKLAAMPEADQEQNYIDALHAALADIDRLTGGDFEKHIDPIPGGG